MTTTPTNPEIADPRVFGLIQADMPIRQLRDIVLGKRAQIDALHHELNRVARIGGTTFTGPVADALAQAADAYDSLWLALRDLPEWSTLRGHAAPPPSSSSVVNAMRKDRYRADRLARHTVDAVPQPCFGCDRFPCACDLVGIHVD